jgi:hypothetical protein
MGEVVKLKRQGNPPAEPGGQTLAYAYLVEIEGHNAFNVVVERDIELGLWTWRAFANVGHAAEPTEDGTFPKLLLTLQEEPSLLYSTPQEAYSAARSTILAFNVNP